MNKTTLIDQTYLKLAADECNANRYDEALPVVLKKLADVATIKAEQEGEYQMKYIPQSSDEMHVIRRERFLADAREHFPGCMVTTSTRPYMSVYIRWDVDYNERAKAWEVKS